VVQVQLKELLLVQVVLEVVVQELLAMELQELLTQVAVEEVQVITHLILLALEALVSLSSHTLAHKYLTVV